MLSENTGTRKLSIGALRARERCAPVENLVPRKEIVTAARHAAIAMSLRPSVRQVLGELAATYGEQQLARGLIVWPSNCYLTTRTGLTERAVRRIIRELIALELLTPVDSPNRKRFAIRDRQGEIVDAFGFDLRPLWSRRQDFADMIETIKIAKDAMKRDFDVLTMHRKACEEALRALGEHFPGQAPRDLIASFEFLVEITPPRSHQKIQDGLTTRWSDLRHRLEDLFLTLHAEKKESGRAGASDPHKEQNNGLSARPCKGSGDNVSPDLLLRACPAFKSYAGSISAMKDVTTIGAWLRSSIGAHPDAWSEALRILGAEKAAVLVIYVLQLHEDDVNSGRNRIQNPGGLFRSLARKTQTGEFDLGRELLTMARRRLT